MPACRGGGRGLVRGRAATGRELSCSLSHGRLVEQVCLLPAWSQASVNPIGKCMLIKFIGKHVLAKTSFKVVIQVSEGSESNRDQYNIC